MRLYTRTGDQGETGLLGGVRLPKDDIRFDTIGTLDELNATLGVALTHLNHPEAFADIRELVGTVQADLFAIGAYLAEPELPAVSPLADTRIATLERAIDTWDTEAGPLTAFVLPGGAPAAAAFHVARAVCRRAERCLITASNSLPVTPTVRTYLNRLSDLLFAVARVVNVRSGHPETTWSGKAGA